VVNKSSLKRALPALGKDQLWYLRLQGESWWEGGGAFLKLLLFVLSSWDMAQGKVNTVLVCKTFDRNDGEHRSTVATFDPAEVLQ